MQDLLEMKDQAIAMIAHDLRNPISQVDGILQLLENELKESSNVELLSMAKESVSHAYEILQDLNDATRNRVEGKEIEMEPTAIAPMLQKCADAFKMKLESKAISLNIEVPENLYLNLNETKMIRAVENLISNAIKFSDKHKSIHLRAWREDNHACISVEDAGIGIPEDIRKRLFSGISHGIRRAGTEGENSIGIGLSIVKGVVDLHHGRIKVESEVGEGSKFTICLPN